MADLHTTTLHTTTLSLSEQAAREAVAREHYALAFKTGLAFWQVSGDEIREGLRDDRGEVKAALLGARAAHSATLEAVVRAAEIDLRSVEIPSAMADDPVQAHAWLAAMLAARERLLALLPKDPRT